MPSVVWLVPVGLALLLVLASTGGCDRGPSEEEIRAQLYQARSERADLLDELFEEHVRHAGGLDVWKILDQVAREARRRVFEVQIRTLGRGERPNLTTETAEEFFERPSVRTRARRFVELDRDVQRLERVVEAQETE